MAKKNADIKKEEADFYEFHDWVANKFGYKSSTSGWAYMIEDQRDDKEDCSVAKSILNLAFPEDKRNGSAVIFHPSFSNACLTLAHFLDF